MGAVIGRNDGRGNRYCRTVRSNTDDQDGVIDPLKPVGVGILFVSVGMILRIDPVAPRGPVETVGLVGAVAVGFAVIVLNWRLRSVRINADGGIQSV